MYFQDRKMVSAAQQMLQDSRTKIELLRMQIVKVGQAKEEEREAIDGEFSLVFSWRKQLSEDLEIIVLNTNLRTNEYFIPDKFCENTTFFVFTWKHLYIHKHKSVFHERGSQDIITPETPRINTEFGSSAFSFFSPDKWNKSEEMLRIKPLVYLSHFETVGKCVYEGVILFYLINFSIFYLFIYLLAYLYKKTQ